MQLFSQLPGLVQPQNLRRRLHQNAVADAIPQFTKRIQSEGVQDIRLITAIKTPYLTNGRFDLDAYDEHVQQQIDNGVEGLIVGGTTGEGQLMSWDEHIMLIAHTVNVFGSQIKVIGNTGSNSTREAVHATRQGFIVGMHAALQINPYYGKTSQVGLVDHFQRVLDLGPGIIYNVPGRTGQDIPDEVIMGLSNHANFLGVKECTGNERIGGYSKQGVSCWSGNDDEAHDARHSFGGQGVISVTSNILPAAFSKMMSSTAQPELRDKLADVTDYLFTEPNPIPINTAMAMCGLCQPVFRLPYVPLQRDQRVKMAAVLEPLKDMIPGCSEIKVLEDEDFTILADF